MKKLRSLDLSSAAITDGGPKMLVQNHPLLETLNLQSTPGISDAGIKALVGLRSMKQLILARTQVGDAALADLAVLPQLQFLTLSDTEITDTGLMHLANYPQLNFVNLVKAKKVTDAAVARLRQARPNLRIQH